MSSITKKSCCVTCGKEITVLKCEGCWQTDYSRQSEVRHEATCKPFDEPKMNQEISDNQEAKTKQQHVLIQRVDDWECNAMNQIRQTAEEARQLILKHTTDRIFQIETKLTKLTEQLRQCHRENNFIPQNVSQWHDELAQLTKQLVIPSRIIVEEVSSPLVTNIVVRIPEELEVINEGELLDKYFVLGFQKAIRLRRFAEELSAKRRQLVSLFDELFIPSIKLCR